MHLLTYPTSLSRPSVDIRSAPSKLIAACAPTIIRHPVTRFRNYSLAAHHSCRVTKFPDFLVTESRASFPVSCRWRRCIGQPYLSNSRTSATSDFSETAPVEESCPTFNAQSPSGSGYRETVQAGDRAASAPLDNHVDGKKLGNDDRWLGLFRSSDLRPLAAGFLLMAAFVLSVPRRALALDISPLTAPPPASRSETMPATFESVQKSPPASASASAVAEKAVEVREDGKKQSSKPLEAARMGLDASAQLLEWERTAGSADVATLKTELKNQLLSGSFHASLVTLERLIELEPSQEEWVIIAAQTFLALGETQRAKNIYNDILQINPFSPRALQGLTAIMQSVGEDSLVLGLIEGKVQQALEAGLQPEVINLKLLLGQVHTLQGNVKAALAEYEQVSKEAPKDFRPYLCQGLVYILMGDKEKADASFVEFQQRCPKDFPLRSTVDDVLLESQLATRRMGAQKRQGGNSDASKKLSPSLSQPTFPSSSGGGDITASEE